MANSPVKRQPKRPNQFTNEKLLDRTGWAILAALQDDARLSFHALGKRVGLSGPAVADRVRRLEEAGIIAGYRAMVPAAAVGLPVTAFVRLTAFSPDRYYARAVVLFGSIPQVREAHHVAGDDSFIVKVVARDIAELETVVGRMTTYGRSVTSIVFSTALARTTLEQPSIK